MEIQLHDPGNCGPPAEIGGREPLDAAELTRRMLEGDEMAYRIFHDSYFNRLSRYLLVVCNGNEDAMREALQATFTRVVRHVKVFPDEPALWSWLTVLARSVFIDQTRKRKRYLAFLDRFSTHRRIIGPRHDNADSRIQSLLDQALERLDPDDQRLIEWKYFERRTVRDIAAELGSSEKSVESRLVRIRRRLKEGMLVELKDETIHEP